MAEQAGRRRYSLSEGLAHIVRAVRSAGKFRKTTKNGTLPKQFAERLMIAVTEVNGCSMCSYAHAQIALEAGLSADEIEAMLGGSVHDVPTDELPAVLFAQHYAQQRGRPSKQAWERVRAQYGEKLSLGILGAIRMIMVGNTYGIPAGSLKNRFHKKDGAKPDSRSSVPYELAMLLGLPVMLILGLLIAGLESMLGLPLIQFSE